MSHIQRAAIWFAIWLVVSGLVLLFVIWQWHIGERLESRAVFHLNEPDVQKVWLAPDGSAIAVREDQSEISVWRLRAPSEGGQPTDQLNAMRIPKAGPVWSISPDGSRVGFSSTDSVTVSKLFGTAPAEPVTLKRIAGAPAIAITDTGLLAEVGQHESAVVIRDANTLKELGAIELSMSRPEALLAAGPFVAASRAESREATVIDTRSLPVPKLTEYRQFPKIFTALALSQDGRVTAGGGEGHLLAGDGLMAPGPIRAMSFFGQGGYLVAGDFQGVHWVQDTSKTHELLDVPPGTRSIAADGVHAVIAGPQGVRLVSHHFIPGMTGGGSRLLRTWIGLSALIFSVVMLKALLQMYRDWRRKNAEDEKRKKAQLGTKAVDEMDLEAFDPPEDLLTALRNGQCVLWAGSAMSAACGIPEWPQFVTTLAQWLGELSILAPTEVEHIRGRVKAGDIKGTGEKLLAALAGREDDLLEYARVIYTRPAALSDWHTQLLSLPFRGAVTSNLDGLLEKALRPWGPLVLTPAEGQRLLSADESDQKWILKVRGDWDRPESVVVSPFRAAEELGKQPDLSPFMQSLIGSRMVVFAGVPSDEILAAIESAYKGPKPTHRHFAIVPASESDQRRSALALQKSYSVQLLRYQDFNQCIRFFERMAAGARANAASV